MAYSNRLVRRLLRLTAIFSLLCIADLGCALILWPESYPNRLAAKEWTPYMRQLGDPTTPSNPIVLIPGDAGSRLRANLTGKPEVVHYACYKATADFFDIWLNLEQFYPVVVDCWADNMRLVFNNETLRSENAPGVDIDVPSFGNTDTVEWLDRSKRSPGLYFAPVVEALVAWGYERGLNVAGAPFDFRKAPNELTDYYIKLRTLIEMLYRYNDEKRVVVLAHSMGNPVMQYFYHRVVDQEWKEKYLHCHVALAGAWAGAVQVVKLFASGYNMNNYRIVLPPSRLRPMQRSFISSAFLYPSDRVWGSNEVLAITPLRNYTRGDIEDFFHDIDYADGLLVQKTVKDYLILDAPGIETHCVYGSGVATPQQLKWTKESAFPATQPIVIYGEGDGTVNERSLAVCTGWNTTSNQGKAIRAYPLPGADHMGILQDSRFSLLANLSLGRFKSGVRKSMELFRTIDILRGILYNSTAAPAKTQTR